MNKKKGLNGAQFQVLLEKALADDAAVAKSALKEISHYRYRMPETFAKLLFRRLAKEPELTEAARPDAIIRLVNLTTFSKTADQHKDFIVTTTLVALQHPSGAVRENARKTVSNLAILLHDADNRGLANDDTKDFTNLLFAVEALIKDYQPSNMPLQLEGLAPSVYKTLALTWHDMMVMNRLYEKLNYLERMVELDIPPYSMNDYVEDEDESYEEALDYQPASSYDAVQPYLSKPIPAIKLKYFTAPSAAERANVTRETDVVCIQCGQPVAVLGSTNYTTNGITCDICAIGNYQKREGFIALAAAEAHRRRLFDVGYLFTEMLAEKYLEKHKIEEQGLTDEERQKLFQISVELQNTIPKPKKIELQNTITQAIIESYYAELIDKYVTLPADRIK